MIDEKVDHSSLGKTSLFISIICLIIVMIMIVLTVFGNIYGFFLFWPALILSLLSLLLGGIAYFGSFQDIYGLIAAVRIFAFGSDKKIRNFLNNLNRVTKKQISKFAYFSTHALKWKNFFIKGMKKTVSKLGCVEDVCTDILEVRLEGPKGPAREGANEKINNYVLTLKEFMK